MDNPYSKKVLCVEKEAFFANGKWTGFNTSALEQSIRVIEETFEFRVRLEIETDLRYLQVIPQIILRHNGLFYLHKQTNGGEKRLDSYCPIPFGGHIEEFDYDGDRKTVIAKGLQRELEEEVDIRADIIKKIPVGIIYLDDAPVNAVHIGLFYIYELSGNDVALKEEGFEPVGWQSISWLHEHKVELTYWSRAFVEYAVTVYN
jgi:predicted NUDIX family phosphoesterase